MLLAVSTHQERGDIDELLSNSDVSLSNQDTSVMDGLCQTAFEDDGLQTSFQKVVRLEIEAVVDLIFGLIEHSESVKASHQGGSLEDPLLVLIIKSEEDTSDLSDLGEGQVDSPDFSLAAKTVVSTKLEFSVESLFLEGTSGWFICLSVCWQARNQ